MMNRQDFAVTIAFTRLRTGTHAAHPDECSAYSLLLEGTGHTIFYFGMLKPSTAT